MPGRQRSIRVIDAYIHKRVMLGGEMRPRRQVAPPNRAAAFPGCGAKAVSPWRSQAGPDRCRAAAGRGGRPRCGQRPRGRPPRRGLAGGAVPAFSEPRRPDAGGGGGGAAAFPARDRGGAGRSARRRSAGALPQPGAGLSALGDAQPDPFRDHLQPPVFRPRQGGGRLPRQCRADRTGRTHARGRICGRPAPFGATSSRSRSPAGRWFTALPG